MLYLLYQELNQINILYILKNRILISNTKPTSTGYKFKGWSTIPYVLLRLRPRLRKEIKNPLTRKELTEFIGEVMIILGNELEQGYLTRREYDDYVNLFRRAAEKVFEKHDDFRKEADRMTKPIIELPSVLQKRLYEENDELIARNKALMADNDALMADKNTLLADLAEKDAQLARMKELLKHHHILECV